MKLIEVVPLSVFILYIRYIGINSVYGWKLPFLISGSVAFAAIIFFTLRKFHYNRLFLGANLYLLSGALAIITKQWWLNKIYGELHASGMLAWIVTVGFFSLFSPQGFVGIDSPDKDSVKKFSLLLFLTCICAFCLSFAFRGHMILSEIVPFILIFFIHHLLCNKLTIGKETSIPTA